MLITCASFNEELTQLPGVAAQSNILLKCIDKVLDDDDPRECVGID